MLNMQEVNALGQILNDTYGASSTVISPTHSIKCSLQGDLLIFSFVTIANIVMGPDPREQLKEQSRESMVRIKARVKEVEEAFKAAAGRALKLDEKSTEDSVEIISMSPHNPKRTAYYRRKSVYKIGA
jgi:hypothetical protein